MSKELKIIKKKDGTNYTIRKDRRRYFFPDEWRKFMKTIKNKKHRFFFITLLMTGARIMEVLNIRYKDINTERGTIRLEVTKQRKARKDYNYSSGQSREFFVSSEFLREYKSYCRTKKIKLTDYIFLNNKKLPKDYDNLNNKEKKKYYFSRITYYSTLLKQKLKEAGIKDYYNFSPHNIRKTYGNWMRTFDIQNSELCYRMGHDIKTYMSHYGSALIFTPEERREILKIMGDVK